MEYAFVVKMSFWVGFLLAGQVALTVGLVFLFSAMKGATKALGAMLKEAKKWMGDPKKWMEEADHEE